MSALPISEMPPPEIPNPAGLIHRYDPVHEPPCERLVSPISRMELPCLAVPAMGSGEIVAAVSASKTSFIMHGNQIMLAGPIGTAALLDLAGRIHEAAEVTGPTYHCVAVTVPVRHGQIRLLVVSRVGRAPESAEHQSRAVAHPVHPTGLVFCLPRVLPGALHTEDRVERSAV